MNIQKYTFGILLLSHLAISAHPPVENTEDLSSGDTVYPRLFSLDFFPLAPEAACCKTPFGCAYAIMEIYRKKTNDIFSGQKLTDEQRFGKMGARTLENSAALDWALNIIRRSLPSDTFEITSTKNLSPDEMALWHKQYCERIANMKERIDEIYEYVFMMRDTLTYQPSPSVSPSRRTPIAKQPIAHKHRHNRRTGSS